MFENMYQSKMTDKCWKKPKQNCVVRHFSRNTIQKNGTYKFRFNIKIIWIELFVHYNWNTFFHLLFSSLFSITCFHRFFQFTKKTNNVFDLTIWRVFHNSFACGKYSGLIYHIVVLMSLQTQTLWRNFELSSTPSSYIRLSISVSLEGWCWILWL